VLHPCWWRLLLLLLLLLSVTGEGGLVGLWRQDFISAVDGLGHAEWVGRCLSRTGTGITFLGDTGSQVSGSSSSSSSSGGGQRIGALM
jgi:hypothetical protein